MTSLTGMKATEPWARVDRAGDPTGSALPEVAAAGGIYASRTDQGGVPD